MHPKDHKDAHARYEQRAFAHYFVFDLHFPITAVALLTCVCIWLMHERVSTSMIAAWTGFSVVANSARELFMWQSRSHMEEHQRHLAVLSVYAWSSLASGITWGIFAWLYIDTSQPLTQLLAGSIIAGLIGVAVTPLSVHLPAFYSFSLPILAPYFYIMVQAGGAEQLILAGMTVVFFGVISRYAHDSHKMHRETVRLRFDNQRLIADLEQRNAEVESASRNKSLFLAGISHDLKQPIRAIGMYTGFLRHSVAQEITPQVVTQTAEKIETAASAIHRQISRLLELSRLESGAMPIQVEALNLDDALTLVHELLVSEARGRGVQLRFSPGRQRRVWADRRMLESILTNFISNAIKHAEGGRVYVGTRLRTNYPEGQRLCIEVRDNGAGIAAHQLPLLFDAYRSFDDREASESHGLGLAIAKAQATYLGCDIDVRSLPGYGSTFTLCGLRTATNDQLALQAHTA
jgi:signal transduction histidine kinase